MVYSDQIKYMVYCDQIPTLPVINFVIAGRQYPLRAEDYVHRHYNFGQWCMTLFAGRDEGK